MSYPLPLPDETNAVSPASYRNEPTIVPLAAYPNLPPAAYPNMLYPKKPFPNMAVPAGYPNGAAPVPYPLNTPRWPNVLDFYYEAHRPMTHAEWPHPALINPALREASLKTVRPWVHYGLNEAQSQGYPHAMTEVALIVYLIGMGYDSDTAYKIVESWEVNEKFPE